MLLGDDTVVRMSSVTVTGCLFEASALSGAVATDRSDTLSLECSFPAKRKTGLEPAVRALRTLRVRDGGLDLLRRTAVTASGSPPKSAARGSRRLCARERARDDDSPRALPRSGCAKVRVAARMRRVA
jgi:hypothetical protein